jgi:hypothetical protein
MADHIYEKSIIAAVIASFDKDALIAFVADHYETVGPWLMALADAADDVQSIADTIKGAEARLAVALAVLEVDGLGLLALGIIVQIAGTIIALRAYTTQVESLRRLRNGGSQFVRVEHVHVNEGGQAVIGAVAVDRNSARDDWSC